MEKWLMPQGKAASERGFKGELRPVQYEDQTYGFQYGGD